MFVGMFMFLIVLVFLLKFKLNFWFFDNLENFPCVCGDDYAEKRWKVKFM